MMRAILGAVWKALRRSQGSLTSVTSNIFFPAVAYFLRQAGVFIWLLAALVLLFPLSSDPMGKIPPERLRLWPLTNAERRTLRCLTPWLNPITWLLAAFTVWAVGGSVSAELWAVVVGIAALAFTAPSVPVPPGASLFRIVPRFPGPFGHIIRKDFRQLLTTLEFWLAALLSSAAGLYRLVSSEWPKEAGLMLAILIVLAFASYSTCSFGLDGKAGITRYRLLPMPGWQILLLKDLVLVLVILVLTLPLAPLPALAAALITLAVAHSHPITEHSQQRWRFSSGPSLGFGLIQLLALTFGAAGTYYNPAAGLLISAGFFAFSLWLNGKTFGRLPLENV